jgi:hypothetical protein
LQRAVVYICNGTMELGSCEHLFHDKASRPALLLKNKLMKETMVLRTKNYEGGWTDSDFFVS